MKAGDAGFAADLEQNHGNLNGEHTGKWWNMMIENWI
jgi:hypothetical protein